MNKPERRTASLPFNTAAQPSDIPHHDGVTHLMFATIPDDGEAITARWNHIRKAIELAGGHVQVIARPYEYIYARDPFVLVGSTAYYPNTPENDIQTINRRLFPFIGHYGYETKALFTTPDYGMDGGNFIHLKGHDVLLSGQFNIYMAADDIDMDELRAKRYIAAANGLDFCQLRITTWHMDCVAGQLPDGRVLIKLDETERIDDVYNTGVDKTNAYNALSGIQEGQLQWLTNRIGRKNCLTFSLFDNPEADVVCGLESIAGNTIAARAFGMAANGIVVGDTFVAEDMPAPLAARLKADGIRTVGPKDVGAQTFLLGDDGFVGGVRCMTLAVNHQPRAGLNP